MFVGKGVMKICSKFTGEHPYRKFFKKNRVKRPKAVPPERKFGPNVILCNSFLGNITSGIQLWSTPSSGHHQSLFCYSRFSGSKSQSQ